MKDDALKNKNFISRLDGMSIKITILFALSLAGSLIFLNRWVVTDLGLHSFGRVWQYYVSYFDYGFVRRAFFGTILDVTEGVEPAGGSAQGDDGAGKPAFGWRFRQR